MNEQTLKRIAIWFNNIMNIFDFNATIENGKIKVADLEFPEDEDRIHYFDSLFDLLDFYSDLLFEDRSIGHVESLEELENIFIEDIQNMTRRGLETDEPLINASNLAKIAELRTIVDYKEYWEVA